MQKILVGYCIVKNQKPFGRLNNLIFHVNKKDSNPNVWPPDTGDVPALNTVEVCAFFGVQSSAAFATSSGAKTTSSLPVNFSCIFATTKFR
jgi:hypothetical protein